MNPSSNGKLTVTPSEAIDRERAALPLIEITDGTLTLIARESVEIREREFPPGTYQVRVQSPQGKAYEEMVFLQPNRTTTVKYPVRKGEVLASAAPVPGTEAMHEFLREPVAKAVRVSATLPCRVVLMASHAAIGKPSIDLSLFKLLDQSGTAASTATEEAGQGGRSKTLSWDIKDGGYVLEGVAEGFGDDKRVRIPLYCCSGWCTLVFVGISGETGTPDLNSASIYLWQIGTWFAPEQAAEFVGSPALILRSQRDTELALHSLVDGKQLLSLQQIETGLLEAKFQNPMLGILGCHLLFQQETLDKVLIATVLKNLDKLIPGHPDLAALKVIARRANVTFLGSDVTNVSWPPMIYEGLRALRDQDWAKPGTIREDSLFDRIRARVIPGRAWTRWIAELKNGEFASVPRRSIPPKSDPMARARVLTSVLRSVLGFTKLLDVKGIRTSDLIDSGLSKRQATLAASFANKPRPARPAIAFAKKKLVARAAVPQGPAGKRVRGKATIVARPVAKAAARKVALKTRARRR